MSQTQTQIPTEGEQVQLNELKNMVLTDIKEKLETGEMLLMLVNKFNISVKELESADIDVLVNSIANLLYRLSKVSVADIHEDEIANFIKYAREKEYEVSDITIEYVIRRFRNPPNDVIVELMLPNGYKSREVVWVSDWVPFDSLSKKEYKRYIQLKENVRQFMLSLKKLVEELAIEKKLEK